MSLKVSHGAGRRRRLFTWIGVSAVALLVAVGVFAANDWFPKTDALTGKKTGWFGKALPKNAASSWNPLVAVLPSPTPQLSKEYIYAGSRLLAVEDANATAAPPADIAIWRPSNGNWMVMGQTGSAATTYTGWGVPTDIAAPGDYDGDGKTDFSVYRPSAGVWFVIHSITGSPEYYYWGVAADWCVPADYDGDGKTDTAIAYKDTNNDALIWWVHSSATGSHTVPWNGNATSIPSAADFDGDGRADVGAFRTSNSSFISVNSSDGATQLYSMNQTGDKTVSSDYDGDGKADPAIYDSLTANWTIRYSTTGQITTIQWGAAGDVPVQNDYDGDGKTDLATFNAASSGLWTIKRSSNGTTRTENFGQSGDIPVPAYYRR